MLRPLRSAAICPEVLGGSKWLLITSPAPGTGLPWEPVREEKGRFARLKLGLWARYNGYSSWTMPQRDLQDYNTSFQASSKGP
jgi:hypothetical protein